MIDKTGYVKIGKKVMKNKALYRPCVVFWQVKKIIRKEQMTTWFTLGAIHKRRLNILGVVWNSDVAKN